MSEHQPAATAADPEAVERAIHPGLRVEAVDGDVGEVDAATGDVAASTIVVRTGGLLRRRRVMIPASDVQQVDPVAGRVLVARTRDQVRAAPRYSGAPRQPAAFASPRGETEDDGTAGGAWADRNREERNHVG